MGIASVGPAVVGPAVADAGPIIHLFEIGAFSLLRMFDPLWITETVWSETVVQGRVREDALHTLPALRRISTSPHEVATFAQVENLAQLHMGEQTCLYINCKQRVPLILTDDLAVRDAARPLQVIPVGSLGIIVRACQSCVLSRPEAEAYLWALYETSSLFVTPVLVEIAMARLRETLQ